LGDVVDGGREDQYPVYLKTRATIGKPVHEIPGNHDPADLFARYIRKSIDTAIEHQWLRFLLLNNARTDSHDGFISAGQIEWLGLQCRQAAKAKQYVIICMHVPAHTNRHPDRGWYVKPDHGQADLYRLIARHKREILAMFHGHFHNGIRGWEGPAPVHEICFPSALYNLDRKLEARHAPGYNLSEFRPGFTRVEIEDDVMRLTYRPLGAPASARRDCRLPKE